MQMLTPDVTLAIGQWQTLVMEEEVASTREDLRANNMYLYLMANRGVQVPDPLLAVTHWLFAYF